MMNFQLFLFCAGVGLLLLWRPTQASEGEDICRKGPFHFRKDSWNTTGTGWTHESSFFWNGYMNLRFRQFRDNADQMLSGRLESPPMCSADNGTYSMSFRYSVPAGLFTNPSCYLAVSILRGSEDVGELLWRSSGGTLNSFDTISPPLTFQTCSSEFKLVFEGRIEEGSHSCGFADEVSIDDVSYIYVINSSQNTFCPGAGPPDNGGGNKPAKTWTTGVIIAIIVAIAVVIIVIAVLALVAFTARGRKRETRAISNESYSSVSYRTFTNEPTAYVPPRQHQQQGSCSDYEPMGDGDGMTRPRLAPSGGSDDYNRLHMAGGAAAPGAMSQDVAHAHYDHVDGDTGYHNLHQEDRTRQAQRQHMARNYHHM